MSLSVAACARASRRARTAQPAPPVFRLDTARQPRDPTSVGKGRDRGRTRAMSVRQGPWTVADVPGQSGRTAVVTGANSGIGFEAAAAGGARGRAAGGVGGRAGSPGGARASPPGRGGGGGGGARRGRGGPRP